MADHSPAKPVPQKPIGDRILDKIAHVIAFRTLPLFFGLLTLILTVALGGVANGSMAFTPETSEMWHIASGELAEQKDALNLAVQAVDPVGNATVAERSEPNSDLVFIFVYDLDSNTDVMQAEYLQEMCVTESILWNRTQYSDYCVLDGSGECVTQANSIVSLFYGPEPNCTLLSEAAVIAKADELYTALNTLAGRVQYGTFVGADALTNSPRFTRHSKTVLSFGGPLSGFSSLKDRSTDQLELFSDNFLKDVEKDLFAHFGMKKTFMRSYYRTEARTNHVTTRWFSRGLSWLEIQRLMYSDMAFAVLSVVFVLLWMRVHTGSMFVALFGMLQIVMSLPLAAFLYTHVLGVPYFNMLHVLIIFLVLGIGADDIFVYHDGWKQTATNRKINRIVDDRDYMHQRVRTAYGHTARAVFNTSFTTAVAFLSQTGSEIMPIRGLGIFATLAIVLNYLLAISFTPVVVLVAERYFTGLRVGQWIVTCFWIRKATAGDSDPTVRARNSSTQYSLGSGNDISSAVASRKATPFAMFPSVSKLSRNAAADHEAEDLTTEAEPIYPSRDTPAIAAEPAGRALSKESVQSTRSELPPTTAGLRKYYVEPMLRTVTVKGVRVKPLAVVVLVALLAYSAQAFHFAFKLTPPNEQEEWFPDDHMWTGLFDDLQNNYLSQTSEQYVTGRMAFGVKGIDRSGFDFWRPDQFLGTPVYDSDFNATSVAAQQSLLDACALLRARECLSDACDVPFIAFPDSVSCVMEGFKDWMQAEHGITLPAAIPEGDYVNYLKDFRAAVPKYANGVGLINNELRFLIVDFLFTLPKGAGQDKTGDVIALKNQLRAEVALNVTGSGLGTVMVAGDDNLVFYDTQEALVNNLLQGLGISTPVVFVLLLATTRNFQIAGVAVFSVLSIVASVLGMCQLSGWDLGVAEAIAGVIVIGFAVDYTLHLGHMYMEAAHHGHTSREARFEYTVATMGSTVLAGAVTTFGSGCFMFLAQFTFFYKMAVLMCGTIAFSFAFSFGFFMAYCAAIGPEGDSGTIPLAKCWGAVTAKVFSK